MLSAGFYLCIFGSMPIKVPGVELSLVPLTELQPWWTVEVPIFESAAVFTDGFGNKSLI